MKEVIISPDSEFIGHGYLQHASGERSLEQYLRYEMDLVLEDSWKMPLLFRTEAAWV